MSSSTPTLTRAASAKFARELSAVRHKKIKALKNKISSGKYRINNFEIAKALFLAR